MEPARSIIAALGGPAATAKAAGVALTAPYRWMRAREDGGTGGIIPHWHMAKLLDHAKASGIDLSEENFIARRAGSEGRAA